MGLLKDLGQCLTVAKMCAYLQDGSYPEFGQWITKRGAVETIEYGFFEYMGVTYLIFPGANGDWRYADFRLRKRTEGGVLTALRSVASLVFEQVGEAYTDVVGGYSLGAVIATYIAFLSDYYPQVILLGSPRAGDQNFADTINQRGYSDTFRVAVQGDPITHSPVNGYWHVGSPIVLTEDGVKNDRADWEALVSQNIIDTPQLWFLNFLYLGFYFFGVHLRFWQNKHDLHLYIDRLEKECHHV